jgi:uncharacterized protein (TIGR00369 family)
MKKEIPNPFLDKQCFYCGSENPEGLNLKFFWDDKSEEVYTEYLPAKPFHGQGNILHGSIQMGLLDEIMGWASYVYTGEMAVTSELNIKFLKPVYLEMPVKVYCRVTSGKGSKVYLYARLENKEGMVCSDAEGTYHVLPKSRYDALIHN